MRGRRDDEWTERRRLGGVCVCVCAVKVGGRKTRESLLCPFHVVLCKHLKWLWAFDFRSDFCGRQVESNGEGPGTRLLSFTAICPALTEPSSFL